MLKSTSMTTIALCLLVGACAKKADNIAAAYVSPIQYQNYSCDQLAAEATRLSSHAAEVAGAQDQKATNDAVAMGVALVLFWPALFMIEGKGATEAQVARLKGEMDAVRKASVQKGCAIRFRS